LSVRISVVVVPGRLQKERAWPASIRRPSRIISIRHLRESRLSGVSEMSAHIANDRLPAEEIRDRL